MEKKITDDHHHQQQPSSSGDSRPPSLKIRIRISPEMKKQLMMRYDKQEEEEAVKEIINVKSEPKELIEDVDHQAKQQSVVVDCSSSSSTSSSSFELKLEATKRKFQDSYQQIANAKRQRRIQVIDPSWNLPPQLQAGRGKLLGTSNVNWLLMVLLVHAKSRLNVMLSKNNKKKKNTNNLSNASRSTLLKPSYIC